MDPIAAMAEQDDEKLRELLGDIRADDADLRRHLDLLLPPSVDGLLGPADDGAPTVEGMELRPHEHYDYIVILASDVGTWNVLCERLGIKEKPIAGRRKSRFNADRLLYPFPRDGA